MPTTRLLSRVNLEANVADTDPTRFQMNSLLLDPEGVVSTDGKVLMVTPYPDDAIEEFPGDDDRTDDVDKELDGSILPLSVAAAIAKALPKRHFRPILACALVSKVDDDMDARATVTNLDTRQEINIKLVDGKYPEWKRAIPTEELTVNLTLSIPVLEKLLKAAKKAGAGYLDFAIVAEDSGKVATAVRFKAHGCIVKRVASTGPEKAHGVIMPIVTQ
jgi:hypothetical protein